ncbi:hypothetical protein TrLO_g484 [Triparma laevis f. longispina]|uniref:Tetratricopeptide repeat protein n=1 Tax=Triparma laevis f. longispina TaxID=1714387 RepID=A0A9W7F2T0_9STRA|nr:hypothetical protein TrLO_g484 [Triparma laevis f. longispina]
MITCLTKSELIEKLRDLVKRAGVGRGECCDFDDVHSLGCQLSDNGEYEEVMEVWERHLAERTKVLGEDNKDALGTLMSLGIVYKELKNFEKRLEYYERALKG